jgi:putative tryptophan/tyrosine transport system substrate-binding protein
MKLISDFISKYRSLISALLLVACSTSSASEQTRVFRIAYLDTNRQSSGEISLNELKLSLVQHGYEENRNVNYFARYAELDLSRLGALANELVDLRPDVIVAPAQAAARAAKSATSMIPIVFNTSGDPVAAGLVASLAHPKGNLTGYYQFMDLDAKLCQVLSEAIPKAKKVAFLYDAAEKSLPNHEAIEHFQRVSGTAVVMIAVKDAANFVDLAKSFRQSGVEGVVVPMMYAFFREPEVFIAELNRLRLPAIFERSIYVARGGLLSYGPLVADSSKEVATLISKVLSGASPSELPVQRPKRFELALNLKTTRQLELIFPPNFLARITNFVGSDRGEPNAH